MKELFKVIGFIFIIYIILFQESLGCPKVTSLKFEPEPPVPVGKQVKMTVDGIDTAGYEDIKLESWSVDGTKLEVTWIGMGTTATYTFTNTGEKKISIQLSGEDKDKDGKRDMREPYETTIVVYKVAKVTGSPVVIQKDGEKNITVTAILEPECEGLVEWQRKRDNGRWEPVEGVGKTVTLLSTEDVGKYKYRARPKGSNKDEDWVESEHLYIVDLKIITTGGETSAIMVEGEAGIQFQVLGIPPSLNPLKYEWSYKIPDDAVPGTAASCIFSQQAKTTIATGRWYADPASKHGWRECNRYARYILKCKVTFTDNEIKAKEAVLQVDCDPRDGVAGSTTVDIFGDPDIRRESDKMWHVVGKGNLRRDIYSVVFLVGVFYTKILVHEDKHVDQFTGRPGVEYDLSAICTVDKFYNRIINLIADTKKKLLELIESERISYRAEEWRKIDTVRMENEAYRASDKISPQYYWQKNWPVQ